MKSEIYTGPSAAMRTSPWLASEDIDGLGDVEVEIEGVYKNEDCIMDGGRREKLLWSVKFKGREKQMILNATNRKTLVNSFGAMTKNWVGKKIKLYAADGIRKPGEKSDVTCKGLRIRMPAKSGAFQPISGDTPESQTTSE